MISKNRKAIEQAGTQLAFVTQGNAGKAEEFLQRVGLQDVPGFNDPERRLYRAFELGKIPRMYFLNPLLWGRVFATAVLRKHGGGSTDGDEFQKSGVFLIRQGQILRSHVYKELWDHPDFVEMATVR